MLPIHILFTFFYHLFFIIDRTTLVFAPVDAAPYPSLHHRLFACATTLYICSSTLLMKYPDLRIESYNVFNVSTSESVIDTNIVY
jgi:hypothetical protein